MTESDDLMKIRMLSQQSQTPKATHMLLDSMFGSLKEEIDELKAENERLREALERIAEFHSDWYCKPEPILIAKMALQPSADKKIEEPDDQD